MAPEVLLKTEMSACVRTMGPYSMMGSVSAFAMLVGSRLMRLVAISEETVALCAPRICYLIDQNAIDSVTIQTLGVHVEYGILGIYRVVLAVQLVEVIATIALRSCTTYPRTQYPHFNRLWEPSVALKTDQPSTKGPPLNY